MADHKYPDNWKIETRRQTLHLRSSLAGSARGRNASDEFGIGRVTRCLDPTEFLAETHALEVTPVGGYVKRVTQRGSGHRPAGLLDIGINGRPDVLDHARHGTTGGVRGLSHLLARPRHLLNGAPIQGDAIGEFPREAQHAWAERGQVERQLWWQTLSKVEEVGAHRLRGMAHLPAANAERASTRGFLPYVARVFRIELGRLAGCGNGGNPDRQSARLMPAQTAIERRRVGTRGRRRGG